METERCRECGNKFIQEIPPFAIIKEKKRKDHFIQLCSSKCIRIFFKNRTEEDVLKIYNIKVYENYALHSF